MKNENNLVDFGIFLINILKNKNVPFFEDAIPLIPKEGYLCEDIPDDIQVLPATKIFVAKNLEKTLIVFFENETNLYRIINNIDKWGKKFQSCYAIAGFDLSPCVNASIEEQRMYMCLNQIINAYFYYIYGIKILANFRIGCLETIDFLSVYPPGINYIDGTLGCRKIHPLFENEILRAQLFYVLPRKLFFYGKISQDYIDNLIGLRISYKEYKDFRSVCFEKSRKKICQ